MPVRQSPSRADPRAAIQACPSTRIRRGRRRRLSDTTVSIRRSPHSDPHVSGVPWTSCMRAGPGSPHSNPPVCVRERRLGGCARVRVSACHSRYRHSDWRRGRPLFGGGAAGAGRPRPAARPPASGRSPSAAPRRRAAAPLSPWRCCSTPSRGRCGLRDSDNCRTTRIDMNRLG